MFTFRGNLGGENKNESGTAVATVQKIVSIQTFLWNLINVSDKSTPKNMVGLKAAVVLIIRVTLMEMNTKYHLNLNLL